MHPNIEKMGFSIYVTSAMLALPYDHCLVSLLFLIKKWCSKRHVCKNDCKHLNIIENP